MKRILLFLWVFLLLGGTGRAQDTLTVMQYNLLQYGNYQGFGGCSEATNNTHHKDDCIRTILEYVQPDILTVCEFGASQQIQDDFIKHNLNIDGISYWKSDAIINHAGSNLINHIFYDSRKMELKRHVALYTNPRDTDVYELYLKTPGLLYGDTTKLVCIVAHPKAGDDSDSMARRRKTMQEAMNHVEKNYANENVLIMGDFNMYRASESGYQLLTKTYSNSQVLFVDPLKNVGGVGEWHEQAQFAQFHTQSTRSQNTSCFSNGGLDDRFDMILLSDEIYMNFNKIKYLANSYYAVGNDGRHYNQSINQNGNAAVPSEVAQALFDVSDHLPVTMKLLVQDKLAVAEYGKESFRLYPVPTDGLITVEWFHETASQSQTSEYRIANLLGQTVRTGRVEGEKQTIDVSDLPAGFYLLSFNGVTRKFIKR